MNKAGLSIPRKKLSEFCRRWKVTELSLFGSVLSQDFNPDSDVDVLVTFSPEARISLFDLVEMKAEMETLFKREVDLVEKQAILDSPNYIRRKNILANTRIVYAQG